MKPTNKLQRKMVVKNTRWKGSVFLNKEQISTLRSLHFWRRNQITATKKEDGFEIEKSRKAIQELFDRADQQNIYFKIQNQVLHHAETTNDNFSSIVFNQKGNEEIQMDNIVQTEKGLEHSITLRSPQMDELKSEYELAELQIVNGINGKEHIFYVYGDEGTFSEKDELGATYVWLHSVDDEISLDMSKDEIKNSLEDTKLYQTSLDDIIDYGKDVEHLLREGFEKGTNFSVNIPEDRQKMDLNSLLVDEEIVDLTYKAQDRELSKQDILEFGKLVQHDTNISVGQLNYFKNPIHEILVKNDFTKEEHQLVNNTITAFQLDKNELFKGLNKVMPKLQLQEQER